MYDPGLPLGTAVRGDDWITPGMPIDGTHKACRMTWRLNHPWPANQRHAQGMSDVEDQQLYW